MRALLTGVAGVDAADLSSAVAHGAEPPPCSTVVTTNTDPVVNAFDGVNSLREAIICANMTPGPDTITLAADTYTLDESGAGEDVGATGDLDVTDELTIHGAGSGSTVIDAGGQAGLGDRVFDLHTGTTQFSISGITIRGGNVEGNGGGLNVNGSGVSAVISDMVFDQNLASGNGGGLNNNTSNTAVSIAGSVFTLNAAGEQGGGINNNSGGTITIVNSSVTDNSAGEDGGGVNKNSGGGVTIVDTTIAGNDAGRNGGGVNNNSGSGELTITGSTISGNETTGDSESADADGGGVHSFGMVTITNSTISGNTAARNAGGIDSSSDVISIESSTIALNAASNNGGGIVSNFDATINLHNTILSGNSDAGGDANCFVDMSSTITSAGFNIDSDGTCALTSAGDKSEVDPMLGPLSDNGGPTQTHALLMGSPAIDMGDSLEETDQRGVERPDGDLQSGGVSDIGAFEVVQEVVPCSLVVTTTGDPSINPADSVNSLREAIICANQTPGDDTITLAAGTYTLALAGVDEDAAATGDLDITDGLTITGAGAATTTIDAAGIDRVLHIFYSSGTVNLSGLTLRGGQTGATSDDRGGGIFNERTLNLTDVIVTNNAAERGAGIYHTGLEGETLTATRVLLANNDGDKGGGILNNNGGVVISDSTISGNTATTQGGGILNTGSSMTITGSTISSNEAGAGGGGGIFNRAPLNMTNSTISGNETEGDGGGISNTGGGSFNLFHVTIADNTADSDGEVGDGGGIFNSTENEATIESTIIAGNQAINESGHDVFGLLQSAGFNLIQDATGATISGDTTGNILGQDPMLGTLQNNGGPTQTHALLVGSPAIDTADPNPSQSPLTTDQRGFARPLDGDGNTSVLPDIGAYEAAEVVIPMADLEVAKSDAPDPVEPGQEITYSITVTSNGPDDAVGVTLTDAVPIGTTFVSFTAPAGWTTTTPSVGGTGTITAMTSSFDDEDTATFTLVVLVDGGAEDNSTISNTAVISSETSDPDSQNNTATETTLVEAPPTEPEVLDLSISPMEIFEGESVTVTGSFEPDEDSHKVTIDWGDGQTTMIMLDPGDGDFTATHKYLDEDPSGTKQDPVTITATVTNEVELSATVMILVKNRPPFFPSLALNPATVPSGGQTTLAGTYTDPGEGDSHLLDVDLTNDGVYEFIGFPVSGGTFTFNIPVNLAPGMYDVNVRIRDDDTDATSFMTKITVEEAGQTVQDVHLFYNDSVHDGNGAAVTEDDFAAIDPTKEPLLFGGTATFANVSGYDKGIVGVFFDVPHLPNDGADITAADVMVMVGNDNMPDAWPIGPIPEAVGVLPDAAPGGGDRIYVTFPARAIVDTWARFTLKANANTGLLVDQDFFFGSVAADTGAAFVGQGQFFGRAAEDMQSMADDDVLFMPATVDNPNDPNRDGTVDAFDLQLVPLLSTASIGGAFHANVILAIMPQPSAAAVPNTGAEQAASLFSPSDASLPPTEDASLRPTETGGPAVTSPTDQRVDDGDGQSDRDLAFATFTDGQILPTSDLFDALAAGRLAPSVT